MGGAFGRKKKTYTDPGPFPYDPYYPGPPPPPYSPYGGGGYEPYTDPYDVYGYGSGYGPGYGFTEPLATYGGPMRSGPYGRYSRHMQMSGMSPWNYGNFYMGNTTMQMMPYMQRKVAKYALRQGMGGLGGLGGMMPMMPMMPVMPVTPCLPASPMVAAAATPLPILSNPIVQNLYPMAPANYFNWMTPSSFMSSFSAGSPYQLPASFQFPSNINMVMPLPYSSPSPSFTPSYFGGFNPQYNFNGGLSCCCSYCTPAVAPPPVCYYPRPVSVPQPCPVPVPTPVPVPNIQQVPVPRPVTVVAPPIVAGGGCAPFSVPAGAPLLPSQGSLTQAGFGQTLVMASHDTSTIQTLFNDKTSPKPKRPSSTRKSIDQARREKAQKLAASLANLGLTTNFPSEKSKPRHRSSSNDIPSVKTHRKSHHHHHHHECIACKHEQHNKSSRRMIS